MSKGRLEAFSDGVIAILITIMVLELKVPHSPEVTALRPLLPVLASYVMSFLYLGIYWNNHHHMLHLTDRVNGLVMWANLHLLFWLSLIPFVTGWMGENHFEPLPTAIYGAVLQLSAWAFLLLQTAIVRLQGPNSPLRAAVGREIKGKASLVLYAAGTGLAFVNRWLAVAIYLIVALMWLVPDRRIESHISASK